MEYFDIARRFVEKYIELRRELAGKTVTPEDQDRLDDLVQHAKESFGKALELAENNYHAAYGYAQFLNRLPERDDRQVEKLLRQVIQFKPNHHWAYNDLGALCIKEHRYQEAVIALEAAAELEPSADVHYNLGLALFHERKMAEARTQFQSALTSPRQGRVHHGVHYYYMIHTYLQEGHMSQAQVLYQKESTKIPAELRERLRQVFET
jgi:tetratricopeptide (TPR) repeat protein